MAGVRLTHVMALGFGALLVATCSSGPPPPVDDRPYEDQVLAARARKDSDFRAASNPYSPIPAGERPRCPGLVYYPVEPSYRVAASLIAARSNPPVVIELPNSNHEIEQKVKVGSLAFTLHGATYSLTAFAEDAGRIQRLWVPFRDLTSGLETYGGGRYLDLDRTATGLYDLDFNAAYHPSCVYDPGFICPYPPSENRLPMAIRAGERLPDAMRAK
jgi:uncharacterized protein (DUF1684 family)